MTSLFSDYLSTDVTKTQKDKDKGNKDGKSSSSKESSGKNKKISKNVNDTVSEQNESKDSKKKTPSIDVNKLANTYSREDIATWYKSIYNGNYDTTESVKLIMNGNYDGTLPICKLMTDLATHLVE